MSLTKADSIDQIGTPEDVFWAGYEEWSNEIEQPMTDEDYESMAAEMGII